MIAITEESRENCAMVGWVEIRLILSILDAEANPVRAVRVALRQVDRLGYR